jgi:hypothetical protein
MKQILILLLILPTLIQKPVEDPLQKVALFLKNGNTTELGKLLASTIELTIQDESHAYSKVQTLVILDNFFRKNTPKSIKMIHKVSNNSNYRYGVVLLATNGGNFRTSFTLKNIKGVFYLTNICIEPEKNK